jgi:hypothetical protein
MEDNLLCVKVHSLYDSSNIEISPFLDGKIKLNLWRYDDVYDSSICMNRQQYYHELN